MHSEGKRGARAGKAVSSRRTTYTYQRDKARDSRSSALSEKSGKKLSSPGNADGLIRLNKFIASSGLYSRREADRLMELGEVTVNDEPAEPGMMVTGREKIKVRDQIIHPVDRHIVVAYYKPAGVTVTKSDPHAKVTLEDVFHYPVHLTYAGRLDRDSEGLLLMTNDGELIDAMMRSANGHEKEYIVRTRGKLSDEDLHEMAKGIWLKDLEVKTKPCRIERLGDYTFRITLTQGLNRQIRRMVKARGHEVKKLERIRVLTVSVKGLHPGMQRELSTEEKKELYKAAGLVYES